MEGFIVLEVCVCVEMGGCLDFSVVEFKLSWFCRYYKVCGLKFEMIDIDNEIRMYCWILMLLIVEVGVWFVLIIKFFFFFF